MTAGLTSRPVAGSKVALAPIALVALICAALLAGVVLGGFMTMGLGSSVPVAQVASTDSSFDSPAAIQFRASERGSIAPTTTTHVRDHIGLSELLFNRSTTPTATTHVRDHIGLSELLFK